MGSSEQKQTVISGEVEIQERRSERGKPRKEPQRNRTVTWRRTQICRRKLRVPGQKNKTKLLFVWQRWSYSGWKWAASARPWERTWTWEQEFANLFGNISGKIIMEQWVERSSRKVSGEAAWGEVQAGLTAPLQAQEAGFWPMAPRTKPQLSASTAWLQEHLLLLCLRHCGYCVMLIKNVTKT